MLPNVLIMQTHTLGASQLTLTLSLSLSLSLLFSQTHTHAHSMENELSLAQTLFTDKYSLGLIILSYYVLRLLKCFGRALSLAPFC